MSDDEQHLTRTEARAGSSNHMARYILAMSLILVVIGFAIVVYIWH